MNTLPFKILGLDHVAIAVKELDTAGILFKDILGIPISNSERVVDQQIITDIFHLGNSKIELLESTSVDSPISKFIDNKGEGLHHIALKVDDIILALDYCKLNNILLIDEEPRIGAEGKLIAFLHPKSTYGVLIELCQEKTKL